MNIAVATNVYTRCAILSRTIARANTMNAAELISAAMKATNAPSERDFARNLGVSHTIIGAWRNATSYPTFEAAASMAAMAGLPPAQTAATVRLQAPEGRKHHRILKRIASTLLICLAVYTSQPDAFETQARTLHNHNVIDIAHAFRWLARKVLAIHSILHGAQWHGQTAVR